MIKKIFNILNMVSQIVLTITALISLFTAYIVFAPDQLPKPFRLFYIDDMTSATPVVVVEQVAAEPSAEQSATTAEEHVYQPGEGIMLNMSTKIINLVDPGGHKYIRLTVVVEFAPDNPEYESLPEEEKKHITSPSLRINSIPACPSWMTR